MVARRAARQLALLPVAPDVRDVLERAFLELMAGQTRLGHKAMSNFRESRGECSHRRCAPSCRARVRLLLDIADALGIDAVPEAAPAGRAS